MKKLFTAMLLVMTTMLANAQLVINELMQSNVECVRDDIHEFPDSWVELYNKGTERVNLRDYKIGTNKNKVDKAWQLPEIYLDPDSYIIIYCDKEDGDDHPLHASFRLDSDKEGNLYLFQGSTIVSSVEGIPVMPAPDIAYGHVVINDVDTWGYELKSTPGAANEGGVVAADHILGAPEFSQHGQICEIGSSFQLKLSLPEKTPGGEDTPESAYITYTTDGSEPTATSALYDDHIDVTGTKVIRAKVFCDGWLSPVSTAQSYIFHPRAVTVPIISIQTKGEYIYNDAFGIYPNNTGKYNKVDWRRPINIEMFDATGKSVINQLGETRIQGGKSRENDLKSMAIYTNKRFDPDPNKKRFSYEFFPDQKPDITEFKSFSLRDGGNDFTDLYFRDLIVQRTMGQNTDIDWQAGHTAALYINGVYKGMLNIRERSNADNIYSNYDGLEDIDMIEISHEDATGVDEFIEELKEGKWDNYNAFKAFYSQKKENADEYVVHTLAEYEEWLDVSEYLNIAIMNLFYGNNDWPGNNTVFWRPRTDAGRWRVIAKDTDFGLGLYNKSNRYNMIDLLYNPDNHPGDKWAFTEPATRLIKNMLKDPDILNLFIDKCCVYMGDFMNGEGTGKIIESIKTEALDEFVAHRQLYPVYGGANSREQIKRKFNDAKTWAQGRPDKFIEHIQQQFQQFLRGNNPNVNIIPISVTINKEMDSDKVPDEVLVNGIKLTQGVFEGKLFLNREITLDGKTNNGNGLSVTKWEIKTIANGVENTTYSNGPTYTFNVPSCTKLSINAVMVKKPEVAIGQRGAVSYSSTEALDFTDQPIEAYIVTAKNGNSFNKKQVYKVPAETGLVVEGAEGTYKIPVADANTSFDDFSGNLLQSTATAAFTVPEDDNVYYGLFYSYATERVGFQKKDAGFSFGKGKSYLKLSGAMAKNFNEIFFEEATAIQGVQDDAWTDGKAYNLNGQRVDKSYKGVMIVNGKKVVNNQK